MGDLELVGATLLTKPGNKGTHTRIYNYKISNLIIIVLIIKLTTH